MTQPLRLATICIAITVLFVIFAGRAEARLFSYTYGAGCCVDHYHYFRCSYGRITPGGGCCEYRGYFMPRKLSNSFYSLYDCWWRPLWSASPGYPCCDQWDGCSRKWLGFHQERKQCRNYLRYGSAYAKGCILPRCSRARAGSRLVTPDQQAVASGTGHLYAMLFTMPDGHCGSPPSATDGAGYPQNAGVPVEGQIGTTPPTYPLPTPKPTLIQPETLAPQIPQPEVIE